MRILAMVGLALMIMGCGAARQTNERSAPYRHQITTILIANVGQDVVRVYDDLGRIATVMSGRVKCVKVRNPQGSFQFSFSLLARRNRYYAPTQNFGVGNGWVWRIDGNMPIQSTITIFWHDVCIPGSEGSIRDIRQ